MPHKHSARGGRNALRRTASQNRVWTTRRTVCGAAGLLAIALHVLLAAHDGLSEHVYGGGVYPLIRLGFGFTFGLLPFAAFPVILVCAAALFWVTALRPLIGRRCTWKSFLAGFVSTLGALIFLFQFLWGFNYTRAPVAVRMDLPLDGLTSEQLTEEFERATRELEKAAAGVTDLRILAEWGNKDFERVIRPLLIQVVVEAGYRKVAGPRVRIVRPKGILMRWNTAGIYVPFSGEGHVDAGMLPVQLPYVIAHEMSHGYAVTDEGDCNFLAYLACRKSTDPQIRFAGILTYWRHVASEFRYVFPDEYKKRYDQLPALVVRTLSEIRLNDAKYPDLLPDLRNAVYDSYLKTQGVSEGLLSYNKVVQMVYAYENKGRGD